MRTGTAPSGGVDVFTVAGNLADAFMVPRVTNRTSVDQDCAGVGTWLLSTFLEPFTSLVTKRGIVYISQTPIVLTLSG